MTRVLRGWSASTPTRRWALGRATLTAALALWAASAGAPALAQGPQASGTAQADAALRQALDLERDEGPAKLEADAIDYDPNAEVVRASGDVQVFYGDRVLRADELIYDAKNDQIIARGNIRLINPDGSELTADEATFDSKIRDGLIVGAKAILSDGRSRLAAVEARRVSGAFTQLSKTVFSPCVVCAENPTPLWRIRARKVVQDQEKRDILYQDLTFDFFGVPVAYLPFFSHADPSVKRRTGFLTPGFGSAGDLGFTAQIPYYYVIAQNRDVTITPYFYANDNPLLLGEYRARLASGRYLIGGSITASRDSEDEGLRGHFFGNGVFNVGAGFEAGFDAMIASDDEFLRRYRFSSIDRTQARVFVQRFRDDGFILTEAIRYQSFREDEPIGEVPLILPQIEFAQFLKAPVVGGEIEFSGNSLYLRRTGGRDVARVSMAIGWNRTVTTNPGFVFATQARLRGDVYSVEDDPGGEDGAIGRLLPLAAVRASYPLGMRTEKASHILEPMATFVWAPYGGNPDGIPNEDSQDIELDELRIFAADRVAGIDRWEDGPRATLGVRYNRIANRGWEIDVQLGQSYRLRDSNVFSDSIGLNDEVSDFVASWRIGLTPLFSIGQRFRMDHDFSFERNEVFGSAFLFNRLGLNATYVFAAADPEAGVTAEEDREEFLGSVFLRVTPTWSVNALARRDIEQGRFVTASAGLRYNDECTDVLFTVGRRFNDVEDVRSSTDFNLMVRLKGFDQGAGPVPGGGGCNIAPKPATAK